MRCVLHVFYFLSQSIIAAIFWGRNRKKKVQYNPKNPVKIKSLSTVMTGTKIRLFFFKPPPQIKP